MLFGLTVQGFCGLVLFGYGCHDMCRLFEVQSLVLASFHSGWRCEFMGFGLVSSLVLRIGQDCLCVTSIQTIRKVQEILRSCQLHSFSSLLGRWALLHSRSPGVTGKFLRQTPPNSRTSIVLPVHPLLVAFSLHL